MVVYTNWISGLFGKQVERKNFWRFKSSSNLGSTPGGAVFQFKKSEGLGVWILMLY